MALMNIDVVGKVNNTKLGYSEGFIAVFEAIANSIHSIEDSGRKDGKIEIEFNRVNDWVFDENSSSIPPIRDVNIVDNGVGFDMNNYESFLNSDSTYKANRGGKGIGRFTWLKVFGHVEIESVHQLNGALFVRKFQFENNKNAIAGEAEKLHVSPVKDFKTTVKLRGVKQGYVEKFPLTLGDFSDRIIEHHIAYLVEGHCPSIIVREIRKDSIDEINLNNRFRNEFLLDSDADSFELNNYNFNAAVLKIKSNESKSNHGIYYSAHDRVVTVESLAEYLPDLRRKLYDANSESYYNIIVLVSGGYLDSNVNGERTKFYLSQNSKKKNILSELSMEDLDAEVVKIVKVHFQAELDLLRVEKLHSIEGYVANKAPQYRPLLGYQDLIDTIQPDLSPDKLALELYRVRNEIAMDAFKNFQEVISMGSSFDNSSDARIEEYREKFAEAAKKITDVGKSELVDYVLQRKLLLQLFDDILSRRDNGEYEWEEEVHNLIFPMKKSSDSVSSEEQNLWMIDERLAYHKFLASDLPLDGTSDGMRPDLLIGKDFESSLLYADSLDAPYNSLVIVEFKRPMRKNYDKDSDPVAQVTKYIMEIKSGKAKTPKGRPISVSNNCRYYVYIICDITDRIKYFTTLHGFTEMPDDEGYFKVNPPLNAYVEVMSYNKVLTDAVKRNRIFFDKLGITS